MKHYFLDLSKATSQNIPCPVPRPGSLGIRLPEPCYSACGLGTRTSALVERLLQMQIPVYLSIYSSDLYSARCPGDSYTY